MGDVHAFASCHHCCRHCHRCPLHSPLHLCYSCFLDGSQTNLNGLYCNTVSQYVDVCSVKESNLVQFFSYIFIMANIGLIIGLLMLL